MTATAFEFRNRFWLFGAIFWLGFFCYNFDDVNSGVALLHSITGSPVPAAPTAAKPLAFSIGPVQFVIPAQLSLGVDTSSRQGRHELQAVFGFAALLVAMAAMMRTWATAYLRSDVVQDPKLRSEALVADGPYRYVRNPLYFANMLTTLSVGLMTSRLGWVVMVLLMAIFQHRLISREEKELLASQGEPYRRYLAAVPKLWPSPWPRVPSGGTKPRWKQAWLAEAFFFWGFATAVATLAVTLNALYACAVMGACLIVMLVILPYLRRAPAH